MTDEGKKGSYINWSSVPGGFDALNTRHLYPKRITIGASRHCSKPP